MFWLSSVALPVIPLIVIFEYFASGGNPDTESYARKMLVPRVTEMVFRCCGAAVLCPISLPLFTNPRIVFNGDASPGTAPMSEIMV